MSASDPVAVSPAAAVVVTPEPVVALPAKVIARSLVPEPADKAAKRLTPPVVPLPVRVILPVVAVIRPAAVVTIPWAPEDLPTRVMSPAEVLSTPPSEIPAEAVAVPAPRPTVLSKSMSPVSEMPAEVLIGAPLVRIRSPVWLVPVALMAALMLMAEVLVPAVPPVGPEAVLSSVRTAAVPELLAKVSAPLTVMVPLPKTVTLVPALIAVWRSVARILVTPTFARSPASEPVVLVVLMTTLLGSISQEPPRPAWTKPGSSRR